jgi:putative oxidoreductase
MLRAPRGVHKRGNTDRKRLTGAIMSSDEDIEPRRLLIPGLAGLYRFGSPFAYAFMRFATGIILLPHGIDKLVHPDLIRSAAGIERRGLPVPLLLAALTLFTESFAAAFLALGLFTRLAAAMIWVEMLVIITVYQWPNGYLWTNKGYEFALLWLLLCTAILFRGGGRSSLDRLLPKEI